MLPCLLRQGTLLPPRPSSLQFSHSVVSDYLRPHELQHARPPCLSITNSWSLLMSIESVMPSNHLNLCPPLLLLPSIFPSIRVFSSESDLHIRWPKYWSFSFSIISSNEYSGLISFRMTGWIFLQPKELSKVSSTTTQKHQFFCVQLSLWSNSHIHTGLQKTLAGPLLAK